MQLKKIAALIAFAGVSASAMAAMPADLDAAVTAGRVISISGASAVQKGFTGIIAKMFTGTPTYFAEKAADVSKTDFVGVAGMLAEGHGAWSGKTVVVLYRVLGGSVYGVNSVALATPIQALKVSSACGTSGAGTSAAPYVCAKTAESEFIVPDAGISDVAPALFQSPTNTEGETAAAALTDDERSVLTSTALYGIGFGVAVTKNVGAAVKLNRPALAAVMTGNVGTWDGIDSTQSGDIVMCRRVPGSGTQAVYNMYLGNYPCSSSAYNPPADRDASAAWDATARTFTVNGNTGGLVVVENSSSGELKSCLDNAVVAGTKANDGSYTSYGTFDRDGKAVTVKFKNGVTHKAIGLLSMDSLSNSTTTSNYQFRSLDGAGTITQASASAAPVTTGTGKFPTIDSIVDGTWDMIGMASFNVPARTTGDKLDVLNAFVASAQDPAVLDSVPALKYVAAAIPGSDTSAGKVLRASHLGGDQCAPYNRNN